MCPTMETGLPGEALETERTDAKERPGEGWKGWFRVRGEPPGQPLTGEALEDVLYLRQNRLSVVFPQLVRGCRASEEGRGGGDSCSNPFVSYSCCNLSSRTRASPKERDLHFAEAKEASK